MQIHELNAFTGTLESAYLAIDDGIETSKLLASELTYTEMTASELEAGTETAPRVISPAVLNGYAVNKATGNIDINVSATSGDDRDLQDAITELNWGDTISNGVAIIKRLLARVLNNMGKYSSVQSVEFPFTAEADGICIAIVTPPSNATSYVYITEDGQAHARGSSTGGQYTLTFPVVKGNAYALQTTANYAFTRGVRLYPFTGGSN